MIRRTLIAVVLACVLPANALGARLRPLIVGGQTAAPGAAPWLAYIDVYIGHGRDQECTGTVIAPRLVLTAAHCVENTQGVVLTHRWQVTTGTENIGSADGEPSSISSVAVDPSYAAAQGDDDAAILTLARPTTAPAIRLASTASTTGLHAAAYGWGLTRASDPNSDPLRLHDGPTVLQPASYCAGLLPDFDPVGQLCTLDTPADDESACFGDSGGPLIVYDPTPVEVGILRGTFGPGCSTSTPNLYTSVAAVEPWIASVVGQSGMAR